MVSCARASVLIVVLIGLILAVTIVLPLKILFGRRPDQSWILLLIVVILSFENACEMAEQWQCLLKMRIRNSEAKRKYWRLANGDHCPIVASPLDLGLVKWWAWSFSLASNFDNICKRLCDICDNNNPKVFDVKCLCENCGNFVLCQWEQGVRACKYTAS